MWGGKKMTDKKIEEFEKELFSYVVKKPTREDEMFVRSKLIDLVFQVREETLKAVLPEKYKKEILFYDDMNNINQVGKNCVEVGRGYGWDDCREEIISKAKEKYNIEL
jgi:hypothetical protein